MCLRCDASGNRNGDQQNNDHRGLETPRPPLVPVPSPARPPSTLRRGLDDTTCRTKWSPAPRLLRNLRTPDWRRKLHRGSSRPRRAAWINRALELTRSRPRPTTWRDGRSATRNDRAPRARAGPTDTRAPLLASWRGACGEWRQHPSGCHRVYTAKPPSCAQALGTGNKATLRVYLHGRRGG